MFKFQFYYCTDFQFLFGILYICAFDLVGHYLKHLGRLIWFSELFTSPFSAVITNLLFFLSFDQVLLLTVSYSTLYLMRIFFKSGKSIFRMDVTVHLPVSGLLSSKKDSEKVIESSNIAAVEESFPSTSINTVITRIAAPAPPTLINPYSSKSLLTVVTAPHSSQISSTTNSVARIIDRS